MHYSVPSRDQIFVNMGKNIGKNISKNLSAKYTQKLLDYAKQSTTDALKTTSKKVVQKTAEATGDLTGNNIATEIIKVSKTSEQNNSKTMTNEHEKEIAKKDIYLQKKDGKLLMI